LKTQWEQKSKRYKAHSFAPHGDGGQACKFFNC